MNLLEEYGQSPEVIQYLENNPSKEDLKDILKKLGCATADIVRKGEPIYLEKYEGRDLSESDWIQAMVDHPVLIERPIVVNGDKAVIGRPPSNI
jgi:arsenate reductase